MRSPTLVDQMLGWIVSCKTLFHANLRKGKNFAASIFVLSIVWIASKSSFCGSPGYAGTSNVQLRSEVWNHLFHLEVAKERQFQNVFELLGCTHFKHDFWAFSKRSPSYNIFFGLCRRSQRTAYATIFMSLFRTVFQNVFLFHHVAPNTYLSSNLISRFAKTCISLDCRTESFVGFGIAQLSF